MTTYLKSKLFLPFVGGCEIGPPLCRFLNCPPPLRAADAFEDVDATGSRGMLIDLFQLFRFGCMGCPLGIFGMLAARFKTEMKNWTIT